MLLASSEQRLGLLLNSLHYTQHSTITGNQSAPNVNSAGVEKPWIRNTKMNQTGIIIHHPIEEMYVYVLSTKFTKIVEWWWQGVNAPKSIKSYRVYLRWVGEDLVEEVAFEPGERRDKIWINKKTVQGMGGKECWFILFGVEELWRGVVEKRRQCFVGARSKSLECKEKDIGLYL